MNNVLMEQLSCDLNISKFNVETEEEYGNRLIYSALVAWARVQVLGKSYTDIYYVNEDKLEYHNVDVMHIKSRLSQVAYGMLNAIPHSGKWNKNTGFESCSNSLSSSIVEQLIFCYELSKINNRRLTPSPERVATFTINKLILGGVIWEGINLYSVGMGRWSTESELPINYKYIFDLPTCSAIEYCKTLKKNAAWQVNELDNIYQIFKIGNDNWYSKSWADFNNNKIPKGLSLLKSMEIDGGYFLLKNDDEGILSAKLDKWYYEEKEIYRIMYSLNSYNKTPAIFKAKKYDDYIILKLNSRIPNAEMRILIMSSWPQITYDDSFNRIIPKFLWYDVEKCLNELGVIIKFQNENKEKRL
ncbi:hypothetical protein LL033_01155 [Clostridium estertheticum]|uniref:hypothetical protein n=1 Tax=Clostridium estertheticum TaxID=238834 RepID=UPI001C0B8B3D|nr:hypothetical protein [Clostridium estertheticum]MBU3218186.1 hypothetical protein [Clostridium estertheticum]WAG55875.1 hypothetical protein LL033_01155 [Clostridium estertheticum]